MRIRHTLLEYASFEPELLSHMLYMHIRHFCGYTAYVYAPRLLYMQFIRIKHTHTHARARSFSLSSLEPGKIRSASRLTAEICRNGMFHFKPGRLYTDPMFIEQKGALRNNVPRINCHENIFVPVFALVYLICVCEFTSNSFYVDTFPVDRSPVVFKRSVSRRPKLTGAHGIRIPLYFIESNKGLDRILVAILIVAREFR